MKNEQEMRSSHFECWEIHLDEFWETRPAPTSRVRDLHLERLKVT